ncbi:TRI14-like protein [Sporormia fimetaria CBS 119925]|uniref:TRI14-like protein n=1 Tax=Sporormia fimetaria CBS 119925 TaxID=1340428 RepID=A0A6A6V1D2_9PLEO|nr:TRI14-like protein [Sporormia fimetaria CBS 119925]
MRSLQTIALGALAAAVSAHPGHPAKNTTCAPIKGDFYVKQYQLYPENADFDFNTCKLYFGQLWNASLGIHDPYTSSHRTITFANITHNPSFHMGAVAANPRTSLVTVIADAANAFPSEGRDISGTNWLIHLDPVTGAEIFRINLTATSQGKYGGFQDIEYDPEDNIYVVGTWPGSLLRVSKDGNEVKPWYLPQEIVPTYKGIGGIAALDWMLLAQGDQSHQIWRFDMRAATGTPVPVKITNANHTFGQSDAITLPQKYGGTVLLVSEDFIGISVFESKDMWETAEYKGMVEIGDVDPGTSNVATVQVGGGKEGGIFRVYEPFGDEGLGGPGTAGNRTDFLIEDITEEVARLVGW